MIRAFKAKNKWAIDADVSYSKKAGFSFKAKEGGSLKITGGVKSVPSLPVPLSGRRRPS